MRTRFAAVLATLFVLALAVPASAVPQPGEPGFLPTLATQQVFFHCASDVKVANVDNVMGNFASWDTTAPTAAVTAGEGCGQYDNILAGGGTASAVFEGSFAGNLDTMNIELHRLVPTVGRSVTAPMLVVVLTVDGNILYDGDVSGHSWTPSATGASESTTMSFTGLGYLTEHGDGTQIRNISLTVDSYNEAQNAWVYDTTDVPAGITFNPAKAAFPKTKV